MRNALLMSAGLLCLAAAPALAQNATITTQTPPTPNAQSFTPSPGVSVPGGSATATTPRAGDDVGTSATTPRGRAMPMARQPGAAAMGDTGVGTTDRAMTGMRPMRGQQQHSHGMHDHGMHGASGAYDGDGGRVRVPTSTRASNTGARSTRGEIAPRLPDPNVDSNSPEAFLAAAQRAVQSRQTGRAQEALERAETRLLTRSVEAGSVDTPASNPAVQHISEARRALGRGDRAGALQLIQAAQANAGSGAGMGMQGAGMGGGGGMGMNQGMGMSGGQMGGTGNVGSQGQSTGAQGVGAPVSGNQGMGMSGGQMGGQVGGMGAARPSTGNVGSQGQSTGAQGVGAPVSGTTR